MKVLGISAIALLGIIVLMGINWGQASAMRDMNDNILGYAGYIIGGGWLAIHWIRKLMKR